MSSLVKPVRCPQLSGNEGPTRGRDAANQLAVLAESEDVATHLIDKTSAEVLRAYGPSQLISLHITDQEVYNKYKLFIRCRIMIGSTEEEHEHALALL